MPSYSRRPTEPIGTIGDLDGRFWLTIHCTAFGCAHSCTYDPADFVDTLGADYPVKRLLARCRCQHCGKRGATITISHNVWPPGSLKLRRERSSL